MKAMNPLSSKKTTACPPPNPVGSCMLIHFSSTLCDPMDYSPPGSSVLGILQERILAWVAIPFSRRSFQPWDHTNMSSVSCFGKLFLYLLSHRGFQ